MVNLLPHHSLVFQVKFQSETLDENFFFADELPFVCQSAGKLKPLQNKKGRKFSRGAARKFFGPPYYDPALKYRSEETVLDSVDALSSWVLLCQKTQEVCDSIF